MIRKVSSDGVGYSVVELNDHRHVFAAAIPRSGITLREQTEDALLTIQAVMEEPFLGYINDTEVGLQYLWRNSRWIS